MSASAAIGARSPRALRRAGRLALLEPPAAPPVPAHVVPRPRLDGLLSHSPMPQMTVLVAPAGYGKTTLLSAWAAADARPFAWLALEPADNDPGAVELSVASAVERVDPDPATGRVVLALDDAQALRAPAANAALATILERLPPQVSVVLASRRPPALPLARWRAQGRLAQLGPADLALDMEETAALLDRAGLALGAEELARVWAQTEGWPAAVALAAVALGDRRAVGEPAAFGADDRLIADYLRDEVLGDLRVQDRRLLLETSILDTLSGSLCDRLFDRSGSAAALSELARAQMLIPLDRSDQQFRPHPLIAATLRAELQRREPAHAAELHRRASRWYRDAGDRDRAIRHAIGAGDLDRAAELVWAAAPEAVSHGRKQRVEGWLADFDDAEVGATPLLALARATTELASGRGHLAEHWARTAVPAGDAIPARVEAGVGLVRAALARDGLARMRDDAERAYALEPEASPQRATCRLLGGTAEQLAQGGEEATRQLQEGARRAAVTAPHVHALCLTQLAVGALASEEWDDATELATRARAQVERYDLGAYPTSALVLAASAVVRAHRGRIEAARQDFDTALRMRARLVDFAAWYDVELAVVLARAAVRLSELGRARELLVEANRTLRQLPDAGALAGWLEESWRQLDSVLGAERTPPSSLTTAELRILRYLPTHLSFREIAERAYVSANTVKTQANAVYRKLDASSRSEAVVRARELGLLDA